MKFQVSRSHEPATPQSPKPELKRTEPLWISATASSALAKSFDRDLSTAGTAAAWPVVLVVDWNRAPVTCGDFPNPLADHNSGPLICLVTNVWLFLAAVASCLVSKMATANDVGLAPRSDNDAIARADAIVAKVSDRS